MGSSPRVERLRKKIAHARPELCLERGYLMTESYKQTEGEPEIVRRARALKHILENMTIGIDDDELLVGKTTSKLRGAPIIPEVRWDWYLDELDTISTRDWDRFAPLSESDKLKMKEFLPYWRGKSLYDRWRALCPEYALKLIPIVETAGGLCNSDMHVAHISIDGRVLEKGLTGIQKEVDDETGKLTLTDIKSFEKYQFLKAVKITLEAAIAFARRYSELARSMAKEDNNPQRKKELSRIAEICERVPAKPANSFYEALQSIWLTYVVLMIEGWGNGLGFGRCDQYLFPYYKKDIAEGAITPEEARELVELLYIKTNGSVIAHCTERAKSFAGFAIWANIALGGITPEGNDAVNELTYLFLDAEENAKLMSEDLIIRVHKSNPDAYVIRAVEILESLRGKFKFVSDETVTQQLVKDGKSLEHARDYVITGCVTPTVPARSQDSPGPQFNMPLMLEMALNNGVSRMTGRQIGPKTGDPRQFRTYEGVFDSYKKQTEAMLKIAAMLRVPDKKMFAEFAPVPFQSGIFHGCIEKGKDVMNGGTYCRAFAMNAAGSPNVADSLAAIKKVIFEDKKITMSQLVDALDKNFEGEDRILHLLDSAPKFGNDSDYVDSIMADVLGHFSTEVRKYESSPGVISNTAALTVTSNILLGYAVGALPDGRKAGKPLAEGGLSPYQGRNISGPTSTMRSVAKLDLSQISGGSVLNMKFHPSVLKDESNIRKFASLIRTFCETGGALVQFNIVSTDTLKDAQKFPERHRDLLVRVSTYSAYFVELSPELQEDIIVRLEFQEA